MEVCSLPLVRSNHLVLGAPYKPSLSLFPGTLSAGSPKARSQPSALSTPLPVPLFLDVSHC